MIHIERINNFNVKPIQQGGKDKNIAPIKGRLLFDELYYNLFILARKKQGKTTLIYNIIKESINKYTKVYIFCPSVDKDINYKMIVKWLKNKKIQYEKYTDLENFNEIIEELFKKKPDSDSDNSNSESEEEKEEDGSKFYNIFKIYEKKEKKKKRKYRVPEYLFIFDDLGNEMRNRHFDNYLKRHRHIKATNIISTQYIHDLLPSSIRQMDYIILMKGINDVKIKELYKYLITNIDEEDLLELYEKLTYKKFNFLYISLRDDDIRLNFNNRIKLN